MSHLRVSKPVRVSRLRKLGRHLLAATNLPPMHKLASASCAFLKPSPPTSRMVRAQVSRTMARRSAAFSVQQALITPTSIRTPLPTAAAALPPESPPAGNGTSPLPSASGLRWMPCCSRAWDRSW